MVLRQWKPPVAGARCEVALVLLANHVAILNERKGSVDVLPEDAQNFQVSLWAAGAWQCCQSSQLLHPAAL